MINQADRDSLGHVTPEVKNHALRPERDPHQRSPCAYTCSDALERDGRFAGHCCQVDAGRDKADRAGGDKHGRRIKA